MRSTYNKTKLFVITLLLLLFWTSNTAQAKYSAIFGSGTLYWSAASHKNTLRNSGYDTILVGLMHVNWGGSFNMNNDAIVSNGSYVGRAAWPNELADFKKGTTSVNRIEFSIGGWGVSDFANIEHLVDTEGTGPNSTLYQHFMVLKTTFPTLDAINFDNEDNYDVDSMVALALMLHDMGFKVTLCPYTSRTTWGNVFDGVGGTDVIDRVYLQCYAGGAFNTPTTWNSYFTGLKVSGGKWGGSSHDSPAEVQTWMTTYADEMDGGFMWLFDEFTSTAYQYADAINTALGIPANRPPSRPTLLIASPGPGRIFLDWADNGESDFASYNIYRSSGGAYSQIDTDIIPSAYTDIGLDPDITYSYYVTAVDTASNESDGSMTVSETPDVPDVTPPAAPNNITVMRNANTIAIDWPNNTEPDMEYYNIYCDKTSNGLSFDFEANSLTSQYIDYNVPPGATYYYIITAVDDSLNESNGSDTVISTPLAGELNNKGHVDLYDMGVLGNGWQSLYDMDTLAGISDNWLANMFLVSHWPLDGDANDITGNGHHGVVYGNPTWEPSGQIGGALQFDGADDYVAIEGFTGILGKQSRTVTGWFKTGVNLSQIVTWGGTATGRKWVIQTDVIGRLQLDVGGGTATGTALLDDLQWHHFAIVLDSDGTPNLNEVQFYVDGQPASVFTSDVPIDTIGDQDVKIGVYSPTPQYFNGYLDDVRIYNKALTPDEIEKLAQ